MVIVLRNTREELLLEVPREKICVVLCTLAEQAKNIERTEFRISPRDHTGRKFVIDILKEEFRRDALDVLRAAKIPLR